MGPWSPALGTKMMDGSGLGGLMGEMKEVGN